MLRLDGEGLAIDDVVRVARGDEEVVLAAKAAKRMEASRRAVDRIVARGELAYGIKTGFGELANVAIPEDDLRTLQLNLVRSHAVGVGPPLSRDVVRAALVVRANALARGASGVRRAVVDALLTLLNKGVHPVMPAKGSLGASGDLAPLAHMALVLLGEGKAEVGGRIVSGKTALRRAGLNPLTLEAKEGLALINGTAVMAGLGALLVHDARNLLKDAQVAASLTFEALRCTPQSFDPRLDRLKPHPGQRIVAANLRTLLRESAIIPSHKGPHKVQDAYSIRCLPQVLGACHDTLRFLRDAVAVEINAATDNPLVFPDGTTVSGGNFHGQALAFAFDFLAVALATLAGIAERRVARLVDTHLSHLPAFLTEDSGLQSGMMLLQYTAAALVSENRMLAHPASADSIPTSANQEDWNSMGMAAALKAQQALANARAVVAIEYLCGAQGLEFLRPLTPGLGPRTAYRVLRRHVPKLQEDRPQADDIAAVAALMERGAFVAAVERVVGPLDA
jgi:histidine ammonia-lyase